LKKLEAKHVFRTL